MWHIIKAELIYHKYTFLGFLAFVPLVCYYEFVISEIRIGYVLIISYMLTVFWNVLRNKEKRESQLICLPLSIRRIAAIRILMLVVLCIGASLLYSLIYVVLNFRSPEESIKLLAYLGIILFGFSIYFAFRDLGFEFFVKLGFTKKRVIPIVIVLGVGIQLLTLYAILQTRSSGQIHAIMNYLDKINWLFDPSVNNLQITLFFIFSLGLAYLTLFTFGYRRSYIK